MREHDDETLKGNGSGREADQILQKLEQLEQRQRAIVDLLVMGKGEDPDQGEVASRIDAQLRKIMNQRGLRDRDEAALLKQVFRKARGGGCTRDDVQDLYGIESRNGALDRMRKLADKYDALEYVKGRGNRQSKLMHESCRIGGDMKG